MCHYIQISVHLVWHKDIAQWSTLEPSDQSTFRIYDF